MTLRITHRLEFRGKSQSLRAWSKELGLTYSVLQSRVKKGWDIERVLTTPFDPRKSVRKPRPEGMSYGHPMPYGIDPEFTKWSIAPVIEGP